MKMKQKENQIYDWNLDHVEAKNLKPNAPKPDHIENLGFMLLKTFLRKYSQRKEVEITIFQRSKFQF